MPLVAWLARGSARWRERFLFFGVYSSVIGDSTNVNFFSMESYRGPDRGFELSLTDLVLLPLLTCLGRRRARLPGVIWCGLAYLGCCLIGTAEAPMKLVAFFTLFKVLKLYLLFYIVARLLAEGTDWRAIPRAYVAIALTVAFIAVRQKYLMGLYRIPGPFDHSNTIPLYLNLILGVILLWLAADRPRSGWTPAGLLGCLGILFAIAATQSRAGIALSMMVTGGSLCISNLFYPSRQVRGLTALVILLVALGAVKVADTLIERIRSAPEASELAREEFNYAADLMAADRTFGVGLNSFSLVLTNDSRYNEHIVVMANEEQAGVCHHIYRLTAAELGRPGLAALLYLYAYMLWLNAWGFLRLPNPARALLAGAFLGSLALHLSGFLEWAFRISPVAYQYCFSSAMTAGLWGRYARANKGVNQGVSKGVNKGVNKEIDRRVDPGVNKGIDQGVDQALAQEDGGHGR